MNDKYKDQDIEQDFSENVNEDENEELLEELSPEQRKDIELEDAKAEVLEYKDKYLRVHADFDNIKKRLEREKATALSYANESFARDMLGVIDSVENAIASTDEIGDVDCNTAIKQFREGLVLTLNQTLSALKKHGVEEIAHEGTFDPNFHQVLMQVDSDEHKKDEIVQVMQKGYKLKERVLRPSMVSTAK